MSALTVEELAAVRQELARIDAKCSTLTGLAGAALAFLVTQIGAPRSGWPVRVLLAAAAIALAVAAVLLLAGVLRPRLGRTGFCRYAEMTGEQVRYSLHRNEHGVEVHRASELVVLSRIALAKNRRLQRATELLATGFILIVLALVTGVIW